MEWVGLGSARATTNMARGAAGMYPAIGAVRGAVTAVHRVNQFTVSIPAAWTTSTTPWPLRK